MEVKGKSVDGPISRYVNRRISTRITKYIIAHNIPLTPNQISLIAFFIAVLASVLYLFNYLWLAGLLVQFSSIIDGVDGELARALGKASRKGGYIDTMLDRYADVVILVTLSYIAITNPMYNRSLTIVICLLALSGDLLVSYIHTRGKQDFNIHPSLVGPLNGIASRDVRLFIVFIGSLIGYIVYTLLVIAVITHIYVIIKSIALVIEME